MLKLIGSLFLISTLFHSAKASEVTRELNEKSLERAETLLEDPKLPEERLIILLSKWIVLKDKQVALQSDELSTEEVSKLQLQTDQEILKQIDRKFSPLDRRAKPSFDDIIRQFAVRSFRTKDYYKASQAYSKLSQRSPADEVALGDCLLVLGLTEPALEAYEAASGSTELASIIAYKRAWASLKQSDSLSAISYFKQSISQGRPEDSHIQKQALFDLIPIYVGQFSGLEFENSEVGELQSLAFAIQVTPKERQEIFQKTLARVSLEFAKKGDIENSLLAFSSIESSQMQDYTTQRASATWLHYYHSNEKWNQSAQLIKTLSGSADDFTSPQNLADEIYRFAEASYERSKDNPDELQYAQIASAKVLELFPESSRAERATQIYTQSLVDLNKWGACVEFIESNSLNLSQDSKTRQYYQHCREEELRIAFREKDPRLATLLEKALISKPLYSEQEPKKLQGLVETLVSAIKLFPEVRKLAEIGRNLLKNYPLSKDSDLHQRLSTRLAESKFSELLANKESNADSSAEFYQVYLDSPKDSEVAKVSLSNAILTGDAEARENYCRVFKTSYPYVLVVETKVFDLCRINAGEREDFQFEYELLRLAEDRLDRSQELNMILLALTLEKDSALEELKSKKTNEAQVAVRLWTGETAQKKEVSPDLESVRKARSFVEKLDTPTEESINEVLPKAVRSFNQHLTQLTKLLQSESLNSDEKSQVLLARADASAKFSEWISELPSPDLSEQEKLLYREKQAKLQKLWSSKATELKEACSVLAYGINPRFSGSENCPENTDESLFLEQMLAFDNARNSSNETVKDSAQKLFERSKKYRQEPQKEKYYLIKAFGTAKTNQLKSKVLSRLAEVNNAPNFHQEALALYPANAHSIRAVRKIYEQNPFYNRLYTAQLERLGLRPEAEKLQVGERDSNFQFPERPSSKN